MLQLVEVNHLKTRVGYVGLVALLSGCSFLSTTEYATNNPDQYLKSQNGPDLVVPPPLSTANISDFYRLPTNTEKVAKVSIKPPVVQGSTQQQKTE